MVKKLSEAEFEEARKSPKAVIDFSATWCGPCRMLAPVMEELSEECKADFYNVDVDECPGLAKEFGIVSIPAVAVLENGQQKRMNIGYVPKEAMKAFIEK